MKCQESSRKTPKCSCCDLCIQVQNAKYQKNNSASEGMSHQKTNKSYFKNFAIPDDLYYCKENINRVKSFNERVLKILDDLRQRGCRILDTADYIGPSEDEDEELEEQGQQQLHQEKKPSHLQQHPSHLQQHSHQSHSHSQQHPSYQQKQELHLQEQQHSQHQSHSHSKQYQQKQQSHLLQQEQLLHQEPCEPNTDSKAKLQVIAPCGRIQNLGYIPQSNFLKKIKKRAEVNPNAIGGPLMQCGCANCVPDGICYPTQIMCPCCRCNPVGYAVQSVPCSRLNIRERRRPYSDISSMHDPCTCFRTWRPNPCTGHFPEYQYEIFEREDGICSDEAHIQGCLNNRNDACEDKTPRKKKGKSGHVSRLDKRKRRNGRRKSKPNEKDCLPSGTDFSPSLKRPHPNSCERCWRYASPSRSPVNRPSQRFDPNYRRSHSEVNINSESKGNISKSGSHYSGTNCVDFDPEAKVHDVKSSVGRCLTRTKSADNVKKSSMLRSASPKSHKKTLKPNDDTENSRIKKEELDVTSTRKPKSKNQGCICSGGRSKEILRSDRQNPMPCSPSMFDKKSQRSNSKKSTSNRLSSSESCKDNIRIKTRPLSASQIQTSDVYFDKPRAQSFDRNYLKESLCIPPERRRKCYCTKPRTQMVNMNVICDQPHFYQCDRHCFPEEEGPFGVSNNQENFLVFDKPCPWHFDNRPCTCSFKDLPQSEFRGEGSTHCCCQEVPITLWDRKIVSKDGSETGGRRNEGRIRKKTRKDEKINPRKYCVFYMNKSEQNENDGVEVLIEELTERREGRDSKSESLKNRRKKIHERRSESMALRFQKGIAEKCRRRENDQVLYF